MYGRKAWKGPFTSVERDGEPLNAAIVKKRGELLTGFTRWGGGRVSLHMGAPPVLGGGEGEEYPKNADI